MKTHVKHGYGKRVGWLLQPGELKLEVKSKLYKWNVNTNDDADDKHILHINDCVALHNTHKYIPLSARMHARLHFLWSSILTFGSSWVLLLLHLHHHGHPCGCLFDLTSSLNLFAFLQSIFLFPFFHLSDEQRPELNEKIMDNLCDSATNGCQGTYDVRHFTTSRQEIDYKPITKLVYSEGCESRNNHRYAVVVQNSAFQWISVSAQNQNFTRNPEKLAKVPGAR